VSTSDPVSLILTLINENCFLFGGDVVNEETQYNNLYYWYELLAAFVMYMFIVFLCQMMGSRLYTLGENNLIPFAFSPPFSFVLLVSLNLTDGILVTFQ